MTFIFFFLFQLKIVQQILFNLYLWQLKEYRLDRLKEHINRVYPNKLSALFGLTFFSPLKLPQKSAKAILIFILNLGLNFLLFLSNNILIIFPTILLTPLIFLISLWLIYPFEKIARLIIYHFALRKITNLQKKFGLIVIGITGSYGKSTTKLFIDQILSLKFNTLTTPKSVNTPLGISLLILRKLNKNHRFFIVEMGAYKIGEIRELCNIVRPQIGIITGISNQHLALFGSQENIIKAKSELIEGLAKEGIAIINKQSKWQPILKKRNTKKIYFYPHHLHHDREKMARIPIPDFLKINLEPALILAKLYNIDEKEIKNKLPNLKLPPKTMQKIKGYGGATIIDDSYNANFEGTLAALDYLKKIKTKKKIVVMPCLIELGQDSEKIHQEIGKKLIQIIDLAIITSDDYIAAIKNGAGKSQKIICLSHPKKIIEFLSPIVNKNSIILIEGKVHSSIINFLIMNRSIKIKKPINIAISPNTETDDLVLVKTLFFQPQLHQKDNYLKQLEQKIKSKFGFKYVFLTNSGRSALYLLLKALNFKSRSEIALQGFTCNAAVNPLLWNNLKPLYIDIDDSWNLDPDDLKKKITKNTKTVIIQHSFGIPADIEKIKTICQKHNLLLIEDMALSIGAKYNNQYCGTFSGAAYFSFGRDKVISSVFGGALATNNQQIAKKIAKVYHSVPYPSIFWTYQQLLHPLIFSKIIPIYHWKLARIIIYLLQKSRLLSLPVSKIENESKKPPFFPAKLPNQLAALAIKQLVKLEIFNQYRLKLAHLYQQELNFPCQKVDKNKQPIYLRYNIVIDNAQEIIKKLRKERIYLGDWYTKPIDPKQTNLERFGYRRGMCPKAEKIAGKIINLPTHINISEKDARLIVNYIKTVFNKDSL